MLKCSIQMHANIPRMIASGRPMFNSSFNKMYEPKSRFGLRLITAAAASQRLAAGSFLVDRAEASPAHRSTDPESRMLASLHCKHPGVRSEYSNGLATVQGIDRGTDRT